MKCKHYKAWIIDSALGVSPKHNAACEAELRRHLAVCPLCREEFERERRLAGVIDHTIRRSLAAEPSARLAAQVRQKVAGNAGPPETLFWPLFHVPRWAAVAIACAVVLAGGAIWKNHRLPATRSLTSAIDMARMENPSAESSKSAEKGPRSITRRLTAATPLSKRGSTVHAATRIESRPRRVRTVKRAEPQTPQVLVPKNEMALVLQLYNGTRTGKIDGASLVATPPGFKREADGSLVPAPIEIKPIEIAKLDVGPGPSSVE